MAALRSWSQDPSPLLGVFEDRDLEFKSAPWDLTTPAGRAELAKDIAGMANQGGGLIVIGIETERDPHSGRDRSKTIRPVRADPKLRQRMQSVAGSWLYPPQRDLVIEEWPNEEGERLVSIQVPPHRDLGGLVVALGPDKRFFGIPIRTQSGVDLCQASEVYDWIRLGRAPSAEPTDDVQEQMDRVRSEFIDPGPAQAAWFVLQAWPGTRCRLQRIHSHQGLRGLFLKKPPKSRASGFGWWGTEPQTDSSGGLRVSTGRIALWVTPSAVCTLVVSQDRLTWAMDGTIGTSGSLINSIVLGELTWEFCQLSSLLVGLCRPRPSEVTFGWTFFGAGKPLLLGAGRPGKAGYAAGARPAPGDKITDSRTWRIGATGWAEEAAASLLKDIYSAFGLGPEAVPHLTPDGTRFDPTLL
jgi:hypothetical protein